MPSYFIDERDVRFVLFEQLGVGSLCSLPIYSEYSDETFEMVLNEAMKVAEKTFEANPEGDKIGAKWDNGKVTLSPAFYEVYKPYCEGGWVSPCEPVEDGGQGLPLAVGAMVTEMFAAANFAFLCLPNLTHGSGRLIQFFGSEEQKRLFMDKMYSGEWSGTMCLTEPSAGSDVGNLKTKAVKNPDGTYSISGTKIFITFGEHDATENIIHLTLARVEGDSPGTKGISIFIVPKYKVGPNGEIQEPNDVYCSGIEEKMGMHGSPTCTLNFGENGNCTGYLLGEQGQGMKIMFYMMNEARFYVGMQGQGLTSAAFLHSVKYAKERFQGAHIDKMRDANAPRAAIIEHPDIRRTLLTMKAYTEGGRAIMGYTGYCMDIGRASESEEERINYEDLVSLLIPVCKGYITDRAMEMTSEGVQVHGGYGYCAEYPMEQFMRDCKISAIYEGTNGIQALDLIGRKLGLQKGAVFANFVKHMDEQINKAKETEALKSYAELLAETRDKMAALPGFFAKQAKDGNLATNLIYASSFMQVFGDVCFAWALLWQANIAGEKLINIIKESGVSTGEEVKNLIDNNKEAAFYNGKVAIAKYFISTILPITQGRIASIEKAESIAWDMAEASFSPYN